MTRRKAKWLLFLHALCGCTLFWKYRNPSCRKCAICKHEQHEFAWSYAEHGWWESVHPGKHGEWWTWRSRR